ncbi:DUF4124 domain-containing protein [Paludibacterium denitrificans]|nr:DUF4124 domain-containing protein [Paludibacterium denitrificans]
MRLSAVLLPLLALLPAVSAHADVYGYVDAQGEVHLASSALDQRYQLFQKTPPAAAISTTIWHWTLWRLSQSRREKRQGPRV